MRKYPMEQTVGAIYDNSPADNPFLAAMPEMLGQEEFMASVRGSPPLPHTLSGMTPEERRQALPMLASLFFPMHYMYAIYDQLHRAITTTYTTRTVLEGIRQTNSLFCSTDIHSYATQADTGSILGVPGIGKTSTIRRCLSLVPQVIGHTEYQGQPFYCKQVLYLRVECPSDCSVKTLAFNILDAPPGEPMLNAIHIHEARAVPDEPYGTSFDTRFTRRYLFIQLVGAAIRCLIIRSANLKPLCVRGCNRCLFSFFH